MFFGNEIAFCFSLIKMPLYTHVGRVPTIYDKFIQLVSIGSMADLKNIKGKNTF